MYVRRSLAILFALAAAFLGGCAAPKPLPPTFAIAPGGYDAAFDAAREVLRGYRFQIDRIDAGSGVISTAPKRSSGFATPWDTEQTTTREDFEDLFNHQQRTVRINFEPAEPSQSGDSGDAQLGETTGLIDLRRYEGPLVARVMVVVEREHRSGWRVETVSIASSSFTYDPALAPRGMAGSYWVPVAQDPLLAGRLAAKIQKQIAGPEAKKAAAGDG